MTSQFKSIIEKIKTDKNVQVAVASIAAATVLVICVTTYYISQTHSQTERQTYKKVASVISEKYEKVRKDDTSETKIDDKLVESISSATANSSSSSSSNAASSSDSSNSLSLSSSHSQSNTQPTQSNDVSSNVQAVASNSEANNEEKTESDNAKEDSSKKKESKRKVVEISSNRRNSRYKRFADQSDWDDSKPEIRKSEEVSVDNWNDEDSVEELNLHR